MIVCHDNTDSSDLFPISLTACIPHKGFYKKTHSYWTLTQAETQTLCITVFLEL